MAIREGRWDCPSCERRGNRGPEKHCAGCGAPRGPEVSFYLPDDAPEVTDAEALEHARAGPDWICEYCGGDNPARYDHCTGCGASKEGAPYRPVIEHRTEPPPPSPPPPARPATTRPAPAEAPPAKPPRRSRRKGCTVFGCLGLLAALLGLLLLGGPQEATVTAEGFGWERSVEIEQKATLTEEAWEGEVPAGARVLDSRREVHHQRDVRVGTETRTRTVTERVQVGTETVKVGVRDLGNGYFEDVYEERPVYQEVEGTETYEEPVYRKEPVYRRRVRYEIDRWRPLRRERAEGRDRSPAWPRPRLGPDQRLGSRQETYRVIFLGEEGERLTYEARSEAEWKDFEPGRRYRVRVRRDGTVTRVEGRE